MAFLAQLKGHGLRVAEKPESRAVPAGEQGKSTVQLDETWGAGISEERSERDDGRTVVGRRKRKLVQTEPIPTRDEAPLTRTVVLEQVSKQGIKTLTSRAVYPAIKETGITSKEGMTVRYRERPNTIAITKQHTLLEDKLLNTKEVEGGQGRYAMEPYELMVSNPVRGAIYLRGNNVEESSESLMQGTHHWIPEYIDPTRSS